MRKNGGYATLAYLNGSVDVSDWKAKDPFANIRRIVQDDRFFFRIRPGLWAINGKKVEVFKTLEIQEDVKPEEDIFTHSYYQGLIVQIGNLRGYKTYISPQDKNKKFLEKPLKEIANTSKIFDFTYPETVNRARNVDVIWFNERKMPQYFFEIEHSTDIKNSLLKFCDLQDFNSKFHIIAPKSKKRNFEEKLEYFAFSDIKKRVEFMNYDQVSDLHSKMYKLSNIKNL